MDLPDARKWSSESLELVRRIAVRAVVDLGMTNKEAAAVVGVGENAVGKWCAAYREEGEEGLGVAPQGRPEGVGRSLSPAEEEEVQDLLVNAAPKDLGIPLPRWTRKAVRELIRKLYGVEMTPQGVGKYLRRWNTTPQKPARHDPKQDPEEVREFVEKTLPEAEKQAEKEGGSLCFTDETGVQVSDQIGRAFAPRGRTPVEEVPTNHVRQNVASGVTPEGGLFYWLFSGNMNSDVFIEYLERLTAWSLKKLFLVLDRHPAHISGKTADWLDAHSDQIEPVWLPRYSPEYNPDEFLNNDLKQTMQTKPLCDDAVCFRETIHDVLEEIRGIPSRIQGYFKHSKLNLCQD